MKVQTVSSGDERLSLYYVSSYFVYVACASGIVTGCSDTAAQRTCKVLETDNVICLPAMQAEMKSCI